MNILISGASGFVGRYLCESLSIEGHFLIGIDRNPIKHKFCNEFINYDLTKSLSEFPNPEQFGKIDVLIHLAAAKGDFDFSKQDFYRDNVIATKGLIKLITRLKVNSVIHYSTVAVYGHHNESKSESASLSPNTTYGQTKLESEEAIRQWANQNTKRNLVVLRPSVVYGEKNYANMYNLLSFLNKKFVVSIGNGDHIKSLISIENLIEITKFSLSNRGVNIYNCTDEPYYTLKELIEIISEVDGFSKPSIKIPFFIAWFIVLPIDIISKIIKKDLKLSIERLQKFKTATDYRSSKLKECGYVQKYTTKERLQNMAEWFKSDINNI